MSQFITDHPLFVFGCFCLATLIVIATWSCVETWAGRASEKGSEK